MSGLLSKLPADRGFLSLLVAGSLAAGLILAFFQYKPRPKIQFSHRSPAPNGKAKSAPQLSSLPKLEIESDYRGSEVRRQSIAGESVNVDDFKTPTKAFHEKSPETKKILNEKISSMLIFKSLDQNQKDDIVNAMFERKVANGEEIIKQGDEGDFFYVVGSGAFAFIKDGVKLSEAKPGQGFGELALLYSVPRAVTVKAISDSVVWAVDRSTFRKLVLGSNARKRMQYQQFLKRVEILSPLTEEEIIKAVDALQPATFQPGHEIIKHGDFGETFYIIEEGTVSIRSPQDKELAKKNKGDYFGEIALLTDGYRVASVVAETKVDCLEMDVHAFNRLLGPCVDILKRNMELYNRFGNAEQN